MAEFVLDKVVHPLFAETDSVNTREQGLDLRGHHNLPISHMEASYFK